MFCINSVHLSRCQKGTHCLEGWISVSKFKLDSITLFKVGSWFPGLESSIRLWLVTRQNKIVLIMISCLHWKQPMARRTFNWRMLDFSYHHMVQPLNSNSNCSLKNENFVEVYNKIKISVKLYFMASLLQCNYTFEYWVILINYMYLLYG